MLLVKQSLHKFLLPLHLSPLFSLLISGNSDLRLLTCLVRASTVERSLLTFPEPELPALLSISAWPNILHVLLTSYTRRDFLWWTLLLSFSVAKALINAAIRSSSDALFLIYDLISCITYELSNPLSRVR